MKAPRFIRFARFALFLLPAALLAKEEVLLDFRHVTHDPDGTEFKCYQYAYDSWGNGKVKDLKGKGALVQAASGKGGLGENETMLRLDKTPQVDLYFLIGNANKAAAINLTLTDKDGTEQAWRVNLDGLPLGTDQKVRLDLTKPSEERKPGKKSGLDLKHLETWQIQGDYTDSKVEVLLIQLVGQK